MAESILLCEYVALGEFPLLQNIWSWALVLGTRVSIYQPQYFPRLHYFARCLNSNAFAIADYLQYVRRHTYHTTAGESVQGPSYQAHTPIKIASGAFLLNVPVCHQNRNGIERINEAQPDYTKRWAEDHLQTIEMHYKKAPRFKELFTGIEKILQTKHHSLADLTIASFLWGLGVIYGVVPRDHIVALEEVNDLIERDNGTLKKVSILSHTTTSPATKGQGDDANDWLVKTAQYFGADEYYFGGSAAAAYMDFDKFTQAGITLVEQDWKCSVYTQCFPKAGFAKNLSIIDLLMNMPSPEARTLLQRKEKA